MILKLPSLPITTNKSLQIEMLARLVLPAHPPQPYKSIEPNRFAVIPFLPPAANQADSASSRQQASQHTSQLSQIQQKNNGCHIPPREHRESPREHRESQASQSTVRRSFCARSTHPAEWRTTSKYSLRFLELATTRRCCTRPAE